MLGQMPATLFTEWIAYDRLDPIGRDRLDLHAALVASAADNAGRTVASLFAKGRIKPVTPDKYLPDWEKPYRPAMDAKTIYQALKYALTLGKHLRKDNGA